MTPEQLSAANRERERCLAVQAAEEERQRELNELIARNRAAERERWEESEEAVCARQHIRALALNSMPTPEALEAMGSTVGDPTRGPAS